MNRGVFARHPTQNQKATAPPIPHAIHPSTKIGRYKDRGSLRVAKSATWNKSQKPGSRPAPPCLTRAKREEAKEGKGLSCCVKFGQETVSETFLKVFLGQFLTLISNMLLISYDYRCISSYLGRFLITVWSLARCPQGLGDT